MLSSMTNINMKYHSIALLWISFECTSGWSTVYTTLSPSTHPRDCYFISHRSIYVSCSGAGKVLPSLTYIVDTTASMSLSILQEATRMLINRLTTSSDNVTRQYTLMEFNDPSIGPLRATCSPAEFVNYINYFYPSGGGDCPEYSMAGLLKALENSPYGTFIVLATDASAKDSNDTDTVNHIFSLLDSMQTKVFVMGANPCGSAYDYDFQVYKDIASHSYGHVFQNVYPSTKVADLLNFFLQIPLNSTTRLFSVDGDSYYYANFSISTYFTSLIISTACSSCLVTIHNPSGVQANTSIILSESWGSLFYVENPDTGRWTLNVYAGSSYSLRILGFQAICSTCDIKSTCKKDLLSYRCVCNEGFSGDGYSCYDINECDFNYNWTNPCSNAYCINTYGSYNCVCSSGYILENKTCVDVDECSRTELNSCHPLATCYNYNGSYSCSCPAGYLGNGYYCEVVNCSKDVCGFDIECTTYNGSLSCLDPCYTYTTLNEPSRSTSYFVYYYYNYYYYYYGSNDYYLNGWFRFVGSGGIRMPEFCPSTGSCFTRYPLWLNGAHPEPTNGIVNRTVCALYSGYCCYWTSIVQIKACPGGYHVYKFNGNPTNYSRYCTDPTTFADSCPCADDEECKLVGGRYGCYCKYNTDISALQDIRPEISCGYPEIKASFLKCNLQKFNLSTTNIHLRDKSCIGFPDFNMTNIISVVSILKKEVCENEILINETHVFYKNTIYLSMDSSLGGEDILTIDYSCVYSLDKLKSIDTALNPLSSVVNITINSSGQLLASIALYQDSSYKTPYEGPEILLTSETVLYVGIILQSVGSDQYSVLMKNCYATSSMNSSSSTKYDIIKDSCPSNLDSTINVIENGNSQNGRFLVQLFGYVKDSNVVYLHCEIHICENATEICTPSCTGMRSLPADNGATNAILSLGPIKKQVEVPTIAKVQTENGAPFMMSRIATVVLVLTGNLLFIIIS